MSAAISIDRFRDALMKSDLMTDAELQAEAEHHGHFEEPESCNACGGFGEHRRGCFEVAAELAWESAPNER